jgi:hypothetical protein
MQNGLNVMSLKVKQWVGKESIDNKVSEIRATYITSTPDQLLTYLRKYDQAKEFLYRHNMGYVPSYILAEAARTGQGHIDVANSIINAMDIFDNANANIETIRLNGKKDVGLASTFEEVDNIVEDTITKLSNYYNKG